MASPLLEYVVNVLNTWIYQVLALLCLAAHLIIVFVANTRRREGYSWWRSMMWTAYQLTNWVPPYVLSNLYLGDNDEPPPPPPHAQPRLVAFWVPFLLLHLAGSDNMSAYAMADHATKWRKVVILALQSMGAIFVLFRYIMTDCSAGTLKLAACIMFFLGIYRYVESAVALRLSDLGKRRSAFQQSFSQDHLGDMREQGQGGSCAEELLDDDDALLLAHAMFYICESAFTDSRADLDSASRILSGGDGKNMRKVVEMQVSLMYDVVYTKAAVVHTWFGYAIRAASPALTATALLLFRLRYPDDVSGGIDVWVSYILLWTTLALDVRCLVRTLVSTWTLSFLIKDRSRRNTWFYQQLVCRGRWKKLRSFVLRLVRLLTNDSKYQCSSYRRWSCNIGQHNLLREISAGGRDRWWWQVNSVLEHESADRLMDLLCTRIYKKLFVQAEPSPRKQLPTARCVSEHCRRAIIRQQNDAVPGLCPRGEQDAKACPGLCPGGEQDAKVCPGLCPGGKQDAKVCPGLCPGGEQVKTSPGPDDPGKQTVVEEVEKEEQTLKFEEAVLMWHITTDVFLWRSHGDRDMSEWSAEAKAIKAMSDYMLFLAAVRPRMLPTLRLRSLYEATRDDLIRSSSKECCVIKKRKTDKELATWMLDNMNDLTDNPILFRGIQDARELLDMTQDRKGRKRGQAPLNYKGGKMPMRAYINRRLPELIPDFEPRNHKVVDVQNLLSVILDEWVRLLLYASSQHSSRDCHANQLSLGGELTTILWIITQHADTKLVAHNCLSHFFTT